MNTTRVCKAFGNTDRLKLLVCLQKAQTVSELLGRCTLSQSALSQHLKVFRDAKLVQTKKTGTFVRYQVADRRVVSIATAVLNYH